MGRSDRWLAFIQTLKIRARDRRIIPLRLNYPQQRLWQIVAPKIDRLEPIRIIVLKFRRGGVSTGVEALLTAFCCSGDNVQALVTAHMKKPAGEIWGMSKRFVTTSPLLSGVATIGNNAISFGRSTLKIATAGSPESERGGDLTACHFSEAGFYPHPGFLTAAMQALPHSKKIFSIGIIESTANTMDGDGEDFYNEWTRAEEGESEWVPLFLGTHEFPDYQIEGAILEPPFSPEEYALRERFEVTDAHLAWRRWCIANNCKGDTSLYHQEYPYTAEEAFVQSGLAFFSPEQLLPMEKALRKGVKGEVDSDGHFTRRDDGPMEIFVFPQPGHTYVVGADSSMGIPDQEGKREHSRSGAEVMDMETMEQVAEFDAASPPHLFARHLVGIGRLYNNALLAPEVQASGGGGGREVLVYIRDMGYWNIHQWRGDPDRIRRSDAILYGWECVDPEAKILTASLEWMPARSIKMGDRIIGCKETCPGGKGTSNALRIQTVVARDIFTAPMVEVVLANGQTTRVSANHPFWVKRVSTTGWYWLSADKVKPGQCVKYVPMWETLRTYEAGRLSAFLDGEGHLSHNKGHAGFNMLVSQVEGPLAEEIRWLWSETGFAATRKYSRRRSERHRQDMTTSGVVRFVDVLRALGTLRPSRLLPIFMRDDLTRFTMRSIPEVAVASVTPIGDGPVVGLTTDPDHTLIADGIVGHNTTSKTRPRMLARIREVVMERSSVIHSRRLYKQLSAFGESDSGRAEALSGRDDLLFAYGIALMSRSENYWKATNTPVSTSTEVNWEGLGIHVKHQEDLASRLRRLMTQPGPDDEKRSFLEL